MMTATNQNVPICAGDYLEIEIPVRDPAGGAVNPAEMTARYKVARSATAEAIISKTSVDGIVISTEDGSMLLTVTLNPLDTKDLSPSQYYHEAEVKDNIGRPFTVMTGDLEIKPTLIK